ERRRKSEQGIESCKTRGGKFTQHHIMTFEVGKKQQPKRSFTPFDTYCVGSQNYCRGRKEKRHDGQRTKSRLTAPARATDLDKRKNLARSQTAYDCDTPTRPMGRPAARSALQFALYDGQESHSTQTRAMSAGDVWMQMAEAPSSK